MLKSLKIQNYKGIEELSINHFSRINIFVGGNNTKKTSILEALSIVSSKSPKNIVTMANNRGVIINSENLNSFFYNLDTKKEIKISSVDENSNSFTGVFSHYFKRNIQETSSAISLAKISEKFYIGNLLSYEGEIEVTQNGTFTSNSEEDVEKYGKYLDTIYETDKTWYISSRQKFDNKLIKGIEFLKINKRKDELVKILNIVDNTITDIDVIGNVIYVDTTNVKGLIPIKLLGDGIYTLLDIAIGISNMSKVIIIDEIENGLHYCHLKNVLIKVFQLLEEKGIQLFATTHSLDVLKAIFEISSFHIKDLDILFHNLKVSNGKLIIDSMDKNRFINKFENGWDIR